MLDLQPVTGSIVAAAHAARVVTPPYDALTADQRAALAAGDPDSYLAALPPDTAPGTPGAVEATLRRCRVHLERLLHSERYRPFGAPAMVVVALGAGPGRAVAVVGDVPVAAFSDGNVRPHEATRPDRVAQLTRYLEVVGVASSPVALTQRPHPDVTAVTTPLLHEPADVAFHDEAGMDVAAWVVTDPVRRRRMRDAVAAAGTAYIADGHHRAAAVSRYAATHGLAADHPGAHVLSAVLPSDHLTVAPFHRHVDADTVTRSDLTPPTVVARLRQVGFRVDPLRSDARRPPTQVPVTGVCHLALDGRWHVVDGRTLHLPVGPVASLDVRMVDTVLLPALGIDPDAAHPVADPLGADGLAVPGTIGIALHPPDITAVLRVADAGGHLPAKTTYVTPKLRSGLLVARRDDRMATP